MTINKAMIKLLNEGSTRMELADTLGVSPALISTWINKENDFVPRLNLARRIYHNYGIVIYPYAENAVAELYKV
jgi:transcriptional regulator with XRE-family HTH domain